MKTHKHLWEPFSEKINFEIACKNSQKNKGKQKQIIVFNENREENLNAVWEMVVSGNFHTSPYKQKKIYEPKERIIYKLPYSPDRIVQHAIMNVLKPIFVRRMIHNTYACIEGRGQLTASLKCSENVRKYKYCLKCDIRHFYPSINQGILSEKIHRIIKDDRFMAVVDDVIFSFPGGYNCPIGNYCSQWFGNYYLSFLDNYVLHELKIPAYERYCDDFTLYANDKKYLQECKKRIADFLFSELELTFSKAQVFDMKQGVDFCGYRQFGKYVLIRKSTGRRLQKRFRRIEDSLSGGRLNAEKALGQIASGNGLMKHACSYHLRQSIHYEEVLNGVKTSL